MTDDLVNFGLKSMHKKEVNWICFYQMSVCIANLHSSPKFYENIIKFILV